MSLSIHAQECVFDAEKKDKEYTEFLGKAKEIISNLRDADNKCAPEEKEVDRFSNALETYRESVGLNNLKLYADLNENDLNYKVTCHNYQTVLDAQYRMYVKNRSLNRDTDGQDAFSSHCDGEADFMTCAQVELQEKLDEKKAQCDSIRSEDQWRAKKLAEVQFVEQMNGFMQSSLIKLKDPNCQKSHSGDFIGKMLKNLLVFSGEVFSLGAGPGSSLAFAGASGLMDNVLTFLGDNQNFLDMLEAEENLRDQACFYKNLQRRTFGCGQFQSDEKIKNNEGVYLNASQCASKLQPIFENTREFSDILTKISNSEQQDDNAFYKLLDSFDRHSFGKDTLKKMQRIRSKGDKEMGEIFKVESGLRGERLKNQEEMKRFKERLKDLAPILELMTDNNIEKSKIVSKIKEYDERHKSDFFHDFKLIDKIDARMNGNLVSSIESYELNRLIAEEYRKNVDSLANGSHRSLEVVFNGFMKYFPDKVSVQTAQLSQSLVNIKDSKSSSKKDRIEKYNRIIKPLFNYCQQMAATIYLDKGNGNGSFSSQNLSKRPDEDFIKSCRPFYCEDGSGLKIARTGFSDIYLQSIGLHHLNSKPGVHHRFNCRDSDSQCLIEEFKKYSCENDRQYWQLEKRFEKEYLKDGTICGTGIKH
ncbi:MAG: hypothetical protein OHK0056_26850 [Bacteriovoracaceae bacterium]